MPCLVDGFSPHFGHINSLNLKVANMLQVITNTHLRVVDINVSFNWVVVLEVHFIDNKPVASTVYAGHNLTWTGHFVGSAVICSN